MITFRAWAAVPASIKPRLLILMLSVCISLICIPMSARAIVLREDIGELTIHDLLLRPNFMLAEPSTGSFSIGESSFALRWELESKFVGVVRIGPRTLLNPTARYSPTVEDDIMLVEGFAEYKDAYGRFRLGRIPVEFGMEGRRWERELIFPRSLLFRSRVMMLRDIGGAYDLSHGKWYTGVTVHNGESDDDSDGRIWYTGRWGFREEDFEIGLSGQTGGTTKTVTALSGDTLGGVDPTDAAKWRIGGLYTTISRRKWQWDFEIYFGERDQNGEIGKFAAGHTDFAYEFDKTFSAHLRYDSFDPNWKIDNDLKREMSLAVVFSNKTRSSNLILVGTKVIETTGQPGNDELRLIWSLSPSGVVRF